MQNNRFEGWYFKQQSNGRTLALIPGRSSNAAFIQIVTDEMAYHADYSLAEYKKDRIVTIADNSFSPDGIHINIHTDKLNLTGTLYYDGLTPLISDIMGPFRFFPMQCRHSVVSMDHTVSGKLEMNGETLDFNDGNGYIEGDSGRSFPKNYTWVQCNSFDDKTSVMASIAHIPFAGLQFIGCIAIVWHGNHEYRFATYLGVRIVQNTSHTIELRQKNLRLAVDISGYKGHSLYAPQKGTMSRIIKEAPACPARFRFWKDNILLFDKKSDYAGFEYVNQNE